MCAVDGGHICALAYMGVSVKVFFLQFWFNICNLICETLRLHIIPSSCIAEKTHSSKDLGIMDGASVMHLIFQNISTYTTFMRERGSEI